MHYAFNDLNDGVYLHTRSSGKLFNISRLKAKTKLRKIIVRELLYADDPAIGAGSAKELQTLIYTFSAAC